MRFNEVNRFAITVLILKTNCFGGIVKNQSIISLSVLIATACLSTQAYAQQLKLTQRLGSTNEVVQRQEDVQTTNTLIEVYENALQKNLPYLVNDREYQQVLTRIDQAKSHKRLQVSADAGVGIEKYFDQGSSTSRFATAGINASLNLYSKELNLNVNIAELDSQMAERQLVLAQQQLMALVAQSYFDLILKEDQLKLAEEKLAALNMLVEFTKVRVDQGRITKDQLSYVQTDQMRADLRLQEAILQRDVASSKFEKEFGISFNATLSARNASIPRIDQQSKSSWLQQAEQNSLKVQIQTVALEIANKDIARARSLSSATVSLNAGVSTSSSRYEGINQGRFSEGSYVGVFINIPLYDGGLRSAVTKENILRKDSAELESESVRRQARFDADTAINGYTLAVSGIRSQRDIISLTQEVVRSTQAAFDTGNADYTKLLIEINKLYDYKYELAQLNVKALASFINLKLATSSLNNNDLLDVSKSLKKHR